jgi:hypothetical protein
VGFLLKKSSVRQVATKELFTRHQIEALLVARAFYVIAAEYSFGEFAPQPLLVLQFQKYHINLKYD